MFLVPQLFRRNEEFKTFYQSETKQFFGLLLGPMETEKE